MIVVISNKEDQHLPFVLKHMKGADIVVIDPVKSVTGDSVDYDFRDDTLRVLYRAQPMEEVRSVWYRRPSPVNDEWLQGVSPEGRAYARSAIERHALAFNFMWPDALWISNFQAIQRAGMKPLQLGIAREVGFNVPETIFASCAASAQQFLERHPVCIAKPQSMAVPEGKQLGAKLIKKGDTLNFEGLRNDPYILQRYIEPGKEYRVTVVGDSVFAAAIHVDRSRAEKTYRDWRKGYRDPSFRIVSTQLRPELTSACCRLVRKLGLEYGAIDLIEDPKGKVWFIEINPNGQWAFVEKATGQPIGKAIAKKLMSTR